MIIQKSRTMLKVFYCPRVATAAIRFCSAFISACRVYAFQIKKEPALLFWYWVRTTASTLFITGAMAGCSSVNVWSYGLRGQTREEFSRYVEEVFRFENKITSEVMMLSDSDAVEIPANKSLLQAEQQMHKRCADLNEYVARDIDGLSSGLFLRRRVEKSAEDCDQAAHQVENLLKKP